MEQSVGFSLFWGFFSWLSQLITFVSVVCRHWVRLCLGKDEGEDIVPMSPSPGTALPQAAPEPSPAPAGPAQGAGAVPGSPCPLPEQGQHRELWLSPGPPQCH